MITVLEMANLVGSEVKIDNIDFSFYFSRRNGIRHSIRVKIVWNKSKITNDCTGVLHLHGDYKYESKSGKISRSRVNEAREFFKKYKVLFSGVWEEYIQELTVQKFFEKRISFKRMIYEIFGEDIGVKNISELERYVRDNNIFNMND